MLTRRKLLGAGSEVSWLVALMFLLLACGRVEVEPATRATATRALAPKGPVSVATVVGAESIACEVVRTDGRVHTVRAHYWKESGRTAQFWVILADNYHTMTALLALETVESIDCEAEGSDLQNQSEGGGAMPELP